MDEKHRWMGWDKPQDCWVECQDMGKEWPAGPSKGPGLLPDVPRMKRRMRPHAGTSWSGQRMSQGCPGISGSWEAPLKTPS